MNENIDKTVHNVDLTDEELEVLVGGFTAGETIMLKSGRTTCSECGMKNITTMTCCGKDGARLALVTLPCGHQTYIPERALTSV